MCKKERNMKKEARKRKIDEGVYMEVKIEIEKRDGRRESCVEKKRFKGIIERELCAYLPTVLFGVDPLTWKSDIPSVS